MQDRCGRAVCTVEQAQGAFRDPEGGGGGWVGAGHWPVWWVGGNRTWASKGGWVGDPTISAKNTLCNTVGVLNYSLYP